MITSEQLNQHFPPNIFDLKVIHHRSPISVLGNSPYYEGKKIKLSDDMVVMQVNDQNAHNLSVINRIPFENPSQSIEIIVPKYVRWITKVEYLMEYIHDHYDALPEYILYMDGLDSTILNDILDPQSMLDFYQCEVLFNAEGAYHHSGLCDPSKEFYYPLTMSHKEPYKALNLKKYGVAHERSLNGGVFLGRKEYMLDMLKEAYRYMSDDSSKGLPYGSLCDQAVFKIMQNDHFDKMACDIYNLYFLVGYPKSYQSDKDDWEHFENFKKNNIHLYNPPIVNKPINEPKFIITMTGPFLKYRLDILREVSPGAKDFVIIFTNKLSYPLYEEHHDFFDFVLMDEYREKDSFSMEHELFPDFKTEKEFLEGFEGFYGRETGVAYPWETHRFIFPYLMENNIKNFAIVDTDFIFNENREMLSKFFDTIPEGVMYMPTMGEDIHERKKEWESVDAKFPEINLVRNPNNRCCDGFFRGFHFKNLEDMNLFYDIWNEAMKIPLLDGSAHPHRLYQSDWIVPTLMQIFETQRDYKFHDYRDFTIMKNYTREIGFHCTRVEDTIYVGPRNGWDRYGFDYSDTSSISNFIKNNKEALINYYDMFESTVTDTHVYTKYQRR